MPLPLPLVSLEITAEFAAITIYIFCRAIAAID